MLIHKECELELGADTVRAAHEGRALHAVCVKLKKPAEAADIGANSACQSSCNVAFHKLNGLVTRGDINACLGVGL